MKDITRVFFVVDDIDQDEEIFETLQEAQKYYSEINSRHQPRLYIALVNNAYKDIQPSTDSGLSDRWNYNDLSDTFEIIKIIKE